MSYNAMKTKTGGQKEKEKKTLNYSFLTSIVYVRR